MKSTRLVVVESPYAGDVAANEAYARACAADCFKRGEAPFLSHLLYTQPGILDDTRPTERRLGLGAGFAWGAKADVVAVYIDRGVSRGMRMGIRAAMERDQCIEVRSIDRVVPREEGMRTVLDALAEAGSGVAS